MLPGGPGTLYVENQVTRLLRRVVFPQRAPVRVTRHHRRVTCAAPNLPQIDELLQIEERLREILPEASFPEKLLR